MPASTGKSRTLPGGEEPDCAPPTAGERNHAGNPTGTAPHGWSKHHSQHFRLPGHDK
ncbi:hypothetical protein CVCC1112_3750 [Paenarthrobacter nicotinovorans]|nr:hypothetical protein CVCC1112_3750 [Paenarthrobacter nicotinovorans]